VLGQGWQLRVDVIPAGLRVSTSTPGGGDPAVWVIAAADFKRGHDIAVRNGLVAPDDSVGLMELLRCSIRRAEELTEKARAEVTAKRNAEIIAAIETDETQVSVAKRLGVSEDTVWRVPEGRERAARCCCCRDFRGNAERGNAG
jgi:hypothetical protein